MSKVTFITGAVRSGKSGFAVELAKKTKAKVVFLATCRADDNEMRKRVSKHKRSRPKTWTTIEEYIDLASVIKDLSSHQVLIIDCLTLWVSNLLTIGLKPRQISKAIKEFLAALKAAKVSIIIVSNEVGWGIVPANKMVRDFRDISGKLHQEVAKISDRVYLMVSGIPLKVKGEN